ncbi:MAG: DUF1640 domain-containing protein [Pseudomonadota bacterium]|nr:DUF1640 domain-containing protein [Pseudomonadota bacterium]
MSAVTFDTHAYVKKLRAVGFSEEQAEVQAETLSSLINDQLATKQDLRELEERLMYRLTLRMGGMVIASVSIVATVVKIMQ